MKASTRKLIGIFKSQNPTKSRKGYDAKRSRASGILRFRRSIRSRKGQNYTKEVLRTF